MQCASTTRSRLGCLSRAALGGLLWMLLAGAAGAHDANTAAVQGMQASAGEMPFGRPGDAEHVVRTVEIVMSDRMRFRPDSITVKRGDTVRFKVANGGKLLHELVIGTAADLKAHAAMMRQHPDMHHEAPYMVHVPPGEGGEIVWQFTRAGDFAFACLVAGHFEAGMKGRIVVRK